MEPWCVGVEVEVALLASGTLLLRFSELCFPVSLLLCFLCFFAFLFLLS
jgi:hypothetical protein